MLQTCNNRPFETTSRLAAASFPPTTESRWVSTQENYHDGYATIRRLADMREVTRVQAAIEAEYGFTPTEEYCRDLIAFVEELSREPRNPV